jgi:hypothetical protein
MFHTITIALHEALSTLRGRNLEDDHPDEAMRMYNPPIPTQPSIPERARTKRTRRGLLHLHYYQVVTKRHGVYVLELEKAWVEQIPRREGGGIRVRKEGSAELGDD